MTSLPCGCCEPVDPGPAHPPRNAAGLDRLAWRIRRHPEFLAAMTAAISRTPRLRALTTREPDDPTIALLDAWAAVLDVLTFYTERIADEGFLRTATERRSLNELAAMVGYELQPGVAAETPLAFQLETVAGAPEAVTVPTGTQVQSLPGPDEQPVLFETVEDLHARAEWSVVPAERTDDSRPAAGLSHCLLAGRPNVHPGDLLLVARTQIAASPSAATGGFELVTVEATEPVADADAVVVRWTPALSGDVAADGARLGPGSADLAVYAPTTARPFGHNAPDWRTLPSEVQSAYGGSLPGDWRWLTMDSVGQHPRTLGVTGVLANPVGEAAPTASMPAAETSSFQQVTEPVTAGGVAAVLAAPANAHPPDVVHLDGGDLDVGSGDLVLLAAGTTRQLFRAETVATTSLADFTLTRPVTKVTLSASRGEFTDAVRTTVAYLSGRPLPLAAFPRHQPHTAKRVPLARSVTAPLEDRLIAAAGKRARVVADEPLTLSLDGGGEAPVAAGDHLVVLTAPEAAAAGAPVWEVEDAAGRRGGVTAIAALRWVAAAEDGPATAEIATAGPPDDPAAAITRELVLQHPLAALYDPATLRLNANVVPATHGETTNEVLGSGDAAVSFLSATLKQAPLTYRATADGASSTLTVRVNGSAWDEQPTLYGLAPDARGYTVRRVEADAVVQFGDGRTGARPPTGQENLTARYRVGSGRAGNVAADTLSQLRTGPLGVKGVTNPLAAEGGDDPESQDRARRDAPLRVRTLERVVSVVDYEDFAAAYPGVGAAQAAWVWDGHRRIVHVTCTGPDGGPLPEITRKNLTRAIAKVSDGLQAFVVAGHEHVAFVVTARLHLAGEREREATLAAASAALTDAFAAPARPLARSVSASEVSATLHAVPDVRGVDLLDLRLTGAAAGTVEAALTAAPARLVNGTVTPAQLLALDSDHAEVVA